VSPKVFARFFQKALLSSALFDGYLLKREDGLLRKGSQ